MLLEWTLVHKVAYSPIYGVLPGSTAWTTRLLISVLVIMHPARPAIPHIGQLKNHFQFGIASLPRSPASSAHEGVQKEEAVASPPHSVDDELARPKQSTLPVAPDPQPFSTVYTESLEMAVPVMAKEDYLLLCSFDGDDKASYGHAWKPTDDRVGHSDVLEPSPGSPGSLECLPNEILLHVLGFLDVSDLLATSRANHLLRELSLSPILHHYRLQRTRHVLPPLLSSPARPTVADLIARSIFLTHTSVVSRRLAWSLISIRLSRRLASRPPAEVLVERCVLPKECVPGMSSVHVAPGLVAKRRAIEKERVKDGLRRWIAGKWKGEVREREEQLRRWHESRGIGRVWRLTKFWERVGRGDALPLV